MSLPSILVQNAVQVSVKNAVMSNISSAMTVSDGKARVKMSSWMRGKIGILKISTEVGDRNPLCI